jgi:hypothetical protein|tara:strand:+ start:2605 stop:2982 length:378 start_codon:yes stop_codon:yes gene_type:complete
MSGTLSKELAGISGDPANPMRQISGSIDGTPLAAINGNGFQSVVALAGADITITLDSGQVGQVLCVLHTFSGANAGEQGHTTRISADTLTAAVAPSIVLNKGIAGADAAWAAGDLLDFTIMVTDL